MAGIDMDLTAIIDAYRGPLIGLIASWGAPWSEAVELAQDSLSEAWVHRKSCRGDWHDSEAFGRWLRGIALNRYRNWSRGRRRQLRVVSLPSNELDVAVELASPEHSDGLDALRKAIERLPEKQRQVVLMHYLEETSVKRVAELLSLSEKAVEGRLFQARRRLYRMLSGNSSANVRKFLLCL